MSSASEDDRNGGDQLTPNGDVDEELNDADDLFGDDDEDTA